MTTPLKVGMISLGCNKNRVDSETALGLLAEHGYVFTGDPAEADILMVNTCGFIESAKQESIDNILDLAWLKENRSLRGIIATGCLVERYREEILREMPEVDALVGVGSLARITEAVDAIARGERGFCAFDDKEIAPLGGDRVLSRPLGQETFT